MVQNEEQAYTAILESELMELIEDLQDILKQGASSVTARLLHGFDSEKNVSRIKRGPESVLIGEIPRQPEYHLPPLRKPRGDVTYPFTNRQNKQGFVIYRHLA